MNKTKIYKNLEEKMVRYADLKDISVVDCKEDLVPITNSPFLRQNQIGEDMKKITGLDIYLRRGVLERLEQSGKLLSSYDKNYSLEVIYGYRALSIQKKLFKKQKALLENQYSGLKLMEAVHNLIAVPEVSGHPTGGAVDIQILKKGEPLDFGTKIWEFSKDSFTFSPFISDIAKENRKLLRKVMMNSGFAPFDGEWWHFSYGDKEWAKYYKKTHALYDQTEFSNS